MVKHLHQSWFWCGLLGLLHIFTEKCILVFCVPSVCTLHECHPPLLLTFDPPYLPSCEIMLSTRLLSLCAPGSPGWPYAVGCVRGYAAATEQKDEASAAVRSKQAQQFDWALAKLDRSVRRTGRITRTMLLRIFHDVCRTGKQIKTYNKTWSTCWLVLL